MAAPQEETLKQLKARQRKERKGESLKAMKARHAEEKKVLLMKQIQARKAAYSSVNTAETKAYVDGIKIWRAQRFAAYKRYEQLEKEFEKKLEVAQAEISRCQKNELEFSNNLSKIFPDSCEECGLPVCHIDKFGCQDDCDDPENPFHHVWWGVEFTAEEIYDLQSDPFGKTDDILMKKLPQ